MRQTAEPADAAEVFVRRLHREHGDALFGWARSRFPDPRDAEEVVAEALVRAWRNHHRFDPQLGSERTWIFAIARTTAVDHHRRSRRHLRAVREELPELDAGVDVESVAEQTVVRDALSDLADHHRQVIVEAYFQGRSSTEIADRLGIPAGTVKSRLYYGLRALRSALEERGVLT